MQQQTLVNQEGKQRYAFAFTPAERRAMRRRRRVDPETWIPEHIPVLSGDFAGQGFRLDKVPYARGIMRAAVAPSVRNIHICATPQSAKTTVVNAILCWLAMFAPGPAMSVFPSEAAAKENAELRLRRLIRESDAMRELATGRENDLTRELLRLQTMVWYQAWANSPAALADRSIRYLDLQEVDKYPAQAGKQEAAILDYASKRVTAYRDSHKIFISSSPTTAAGHIWRVLTVETEAIMVYWVRCPHCDDEQLMKMENLHWPHGEDGHSIDRKTILSKQLATYACDHCGVAWNDIDRDRAVALGQWRRLVQRENQSIVRALSGHAAKGATLDEVLRREAPMSVGFHVPAFLSYFVRLSKIAAAWLKARDKALSPMEQHLADHDFRNGFLALPRRKQVTESIPVAKVLRFRDHGLERGMLPPIDQVAGIFASADSQGDGVAVPASHPYLLVAVGWGGRQRWIVDAGSVDSLDELAHIFFARELADASGLTMRPTYSIIDTQGHRTVEIYQWCAGFRGLVMPYNGALIAERFRFSKREFFPGTTRRIQHGGIELMTVNPNPYKDLVAKLLSAGKDDEARYSLYAGFTKEDAAELLAETRDERGRWANQDKKPNHKLDCLVMAEALIDWSGVATWQPEDRLEQEPDEEIGAVVSL